MLVQVESAWEIWSRMSFSLPCVWLSWPVDAQAFLPDLCICCPSSWLWTEEAQCYQLPRSCCSAGSPIPLITCYSSWTPGEFWVFWELLEDELFHNMFGCWLLGWAGLDPACTSSQEPAGRSYWLCTQWHQVGSLKSAKVWVFIPQKLANATSQGFFFFFPPMESQLLNIYYRTAGTECMILSK